MIILPLRKALNSKLDRVVRRAIQVHDRPWSAFKVCGYKGIMLAVLLAMTLVTYLGLSPLVMAGIALAAVVTFFALVMLTKIITGEERIIYYHHEIAVMVIAAILLWLLRKPILPYHDVTILGIGMFLVCGRIGCLMVGCCHGRPHHWGVCYRHEHAEAGFTPYYVGVRLFPIQLVESLWVLGIVIVGSAFVLNSRPPGEALAWYVITYDLGRFCFEFLRGDPERPYYLGFSQPQWISLILMLAVVLAEIIGVLPFHNWHLVATTALIVTMIGVALKRRYNKSAKFQLLHPHHVHEVAEALALVSSRATDASAILRRSSRPVEIHVGSTSFGIRISAGRIENFVDHIHHFTLSSEKRELSEEAAKTLVDLIILLKSHTGPLEILKGTRGVFHLLLHHPESQMAFSPSAMIV
jgi:hypothetical protein